MVGELDPGVQAKLLRVLQEREIRPVGEDQPIAIDVRVLAATHRDLATRVKEGRFREDLYYRLKVVELAVPPLRERPEDIAPLARHFLRRSATRFGVSVREPAGLLARLLAQPWPGNVRQLENAIESLVALSDEGALDLELLGESAARPPRPCRSVARRCTTSCASTGSSMSGSATTTRTEPPRALHCRACRSSTPSSPSPTRCMPRSS